MTEAEYLDICKLRYSSIAKLKEDEKENFYEYEKQMVVILQDLNREVLEKTVSDSKLSADRRKKKRFAFTEK